MAAASQSSSSAYTAAYTPHSDLDMLSVDPSFTEEEMPFADSQWPFQAAMPLPPMPTPRPRARDQIAMDMKPASFAPPQKPKDLIREW